jgi:hypothetical protein
MLKSVLLINRMNGATTYTKTGVQDIQMVDQEEMVRTNAAAEQV